MTSVLARSLRVCRGLSRSHSLRSPRRTTLYGAIAGLCGQRAPPQKNKEAYSVDDVCMYVLCSRSSWCGEREPQDAPVWHRLSLAGSGRMRDPLIAVGWPAYNGVVSPRWPPDPVDSGRDDNIAPGPVACFVLLVRAQARKQHLSWPRRAGERGRDWTGLGPPPNWR